MSRIDRDACTVLDIEWYGIDRKGNMGVFCSGGVGNVPEFVCQNAEETDLLIKWFDQLEKSTRGLVHHKMAGYAVQVAKVFSEKGLYYFDSDDGTKFGECNCNAYYTKVASPEIPLKYDCLPAEVKVWLSSHFLDVDDFARTESVCVPHAYAEYCNQTYVFTEIVEMNPDKICFRDGTELLFADFMKGHSYVADRNILAIPPSFWFINEEKQIRISFPKRILFWKGKNRTAFHHFQKKLLEFGYTTRDLS